MAIERAKSATEARGVGAAIRSKGPGTPRVQEDFDAEARELADALGWGGGETLVKNDIRVVDATGYLRKILHERHVALHHPNVTATTAEAACEHLGLESEPEAVALLTERLAAVEKREREAVQ